MVENIKTQMAEALYQEGDNLMRNDENDLALAKMKEALKQDPKCMNAICGLGSVLIKLQKYEEAEEQFRRALEIDHTSLRALCGIGDSLIGKSLIGKQRFKEALEIFDEILKVDPDDFHAHVSSVMCHGNMGEFESAQKSIDRAKEIDPGN